MDSILSSSLESEDYYTVLGCDELSTVEQILAEYKIRAMECHPDKQPGNQKAVEEFQRLQQAKETLTNEGSRAQYDYWRRSKIMIPYTQWEALQDSLKMSMHWAVRGQKEPMLEAPADSPNVPDTTFSNLGEKIIESPHENEHDILGKTSEDINLLSPKSPEGTSDLTSCLLRFRWSAEAPSDLLRKFRNYEI
ncbi:dnaJ homolog subfamily C member 12 [Spea bombifrons]|uniref:dnaJ homolog subfamily C member 12 n=1 Tax=Spea bombifrons TaxID=233779 RepID=UPI00234B7DDF|nr:dnaJ homolog subfamily C member 12 [Spea bombifrons]